MKMDLKPDVVKALETMPVIQTACEKVGVGRATFYRWITEDEKFKKECEEARRKGVTLINDLAESKVILGIEEGDSKMIRFWLNNNHPNYSFRDKTKASDLLTE